MRIAVFHNLSSGGAKRSVLESTRRLSPRHHVEVFTLSSADHGFADLRPVVRKHTVIGFGPLPLFESPFGRLNNITRMLDLARLWRVGRSVGRLIEGSGFDVALVHPCRYENSPSVLGGFERLRTVFFCQEPLRILYETAPSRPYDGDFAAGRRALNRLDPLPGLYRALLRSRDRANITEAGTVLVNSRFSRDQVKSAYGVEPQVSYLGVDTGSFQPHVSRRERILLSVDSLTPLKCFDFLIEATGRIPASKRPPLVIASNFENPPERWYLEGLAAERAVDLRLLGNITEEELVALYNRAMMVVYAPIREPFGLVALESMACGTPVVGVREGGVSESVVHGRTGFLVQRDPDRFAAAIERLLDSPGLAQEFGLNGREHVESHWTWERATLRLEEHLAACVAGGRPPAEAGGEESGPGLSTAARTESTPGIPAVAARRFSPKSSTSVRDPHREAPSHAKS